jgi:thiol:disulfide interchange protein DsbD
MAAAIEAGKPLLIDFTGWACVNCRKMEEQVWPDERVAKILNEDVILVSLYVDDRTKIPESQWRIEKYGGKEFHIRTIGKKWSYLQASKFNRNAQPYYVLINHEGDQIGGSAGYNPDAEVFLEYLNDALTKF